MDLNNFNIDEIKDVKIDEIEIEEDALEHAGIKGMKWGIRRYQNPDGSLTPAGRKRYAKEAEKAAKVEKAKSFYKGIKDKHDAKVAAKKEAKAAVKAKEKAKADEVKFYNSLKKKKISEMTDDEVKKYRERMRIEAEATESENRNKQAKAAKFKAVLDKIRNGADLLNSISSITNSAKNIKTNTKDLFDKDKSDENKYKKLNEKDISKMSNEELKDYNWRLGQEKTASKFREEKTEKDNKNKETDNRIKEAEAKVKEAESKAKQSDKAKKEAERKAKEAADARVKEADARVKEAETKVKEAETKVKEANRRAKEAEAEARKAVESTTISKDTTSPIDNVSSLLDYSPSQLSDLSKKIRERRYTYMDKYKKYK